MRARDYYRALNRPAVSRSVIAKTQEGLMDEKEPTQEMIDVGIAAVREWDYEVWEQNSPEDIAVLVTSVYSAMNAIAKIRRE